MYNKELEFERDLLNVLFTKGWDSKVIKYPTEEDLIRNWADILFANNRSRDCLNDYPLTDGEMQQILNQVNGLKTPANLNGFINGKSVTIIRDNVDDEEHFKKSVSLKIYDRQEIAAGQSVYQIAEQPKFRTPNPLASDRRGDFMLLINGMPLFHIELKKSGIPISQATNQIEKYSKEGVFSQGIFSLVQIFVAMTPEETLYFANPGAEGKFNPLFYFHWADFNNEPVNDWQKIASDFLSIPMAHQIIGFYSVADKNDGLLKVLRSYQYFATNAISDRVAKMQWDMPDIYGGYIWHTTGSGKTLTSFKAAQLISTSNDADKVVFLLDRIELGTQTHLEYTSFAEDDVSVQDTENTRALLTKLKSDKAADTLIVTSIQKMSRIQLDQGVNAKDIERIRGKRVVFVIDECHRDTFGDMLRVIKETFPGAIFFGFTGTPIFDENQKKKNSTNSVFGNELHRYSIADGIRDCNVLGFDPCMVQVYRERDLRQNVALEKAKAKTVEEAMADEAKKEVFFYYMNKAKMAGFYDDTGKYVKGIEDLLPDSQFTTDSYRETVVGDIRDNWQTLSYGMKFHGIFATSSIVEAIEYYRLFRKLAPQIKVTALFDPSIDNNGGSFEKETALTEILMDYNNTFGQSFKIAEHAQYKKDVSARLAHKKPYDINPFPQAEQLDLLIVVDQMLTGFDSKWINTLYLDKMLRYEGLIQAFSRTNRLFGHEKPFGTIRYYRKPFTMERNIEDAFKLYSGDRPFGLFALKLPDNLRKMNEIYADIKGLFESVGIPDFTKLPDDKDAKGRFAKLFKTFNDYLDAAKVQLFSWKTLTYDFDGEPSITVDIDEQTYLTLALRYKELFPSNPAGVGGSPADVPYDICTHLTEINTDKIDSDYMDSRFTKYMRELAAGDPKAIEATLNELHKSFASLNQAEQKAANLLLHDVQAGWVVDGTKSFRELLTERMIKDRRSRDQKFADAFGIDVEQLQAFFSAAVNEVNLNEFGRFDSLVATVDRAKAFDYFAKKGEAIARPKLLARIRKELRTYILSGGFEI